MIITKLEEKHYKDFQSLHSKYGHSIYENFSSISKKRALLYEANQLVASYKNGDIKIWVALDEHNVLGTVAYGVRDWDTKHFGFEIGGISDIVTDKGDVERDSLLEEVLLTTALQELEDLEVKCVIFRFNSNETSLVHTLEGSSFLLMDVLLTFCNDMSDLRIKEVSTDIEPCKKPEVNSLVDIAVDTFRWGHFCADVRFPQKRCRQLYGKWIENACRGLTDEVLVAYVNEKPVGFVTCRKDEAASGYLKKCIGIIDLIAVAKHYQGQGIGYDLITSAIDWFNNHQIYLVKISTHLCNLAGIRLDLKSGFKHASSELTFHRWM